jgi:hypothetical protein
MGFACLINVLIPNRRNGLIFWLGIIYILILQLQSLGMSWICFFYFYFFFCKMERYRKNDKCDCGGLVECFSFFFFFYKTMYILFFFFFFSSRFLFINNNSLSKCRIGDFFGYNNRFNTETLRDFILLLPLAGVFVFIILIFYYDY